MNVIFNQSRKLGNVIYKKSKESQVVPDSMKSDWFFKCLVKAGDVSLVAEAVVAEAEAPSKLFTRGKAAK